MRCYDNREQIRNVPNLTTAYAILALPSSEKTRRKRRDKLSPVVDELEGKGIPEAVTRKFFAAQGETPTDEPAPVPNTGNGKPAPQVNKEPKGWTPSILEESALTDEERKAMKCLADASPLRLKAIVRSICEGGLLGGGV